MRRSIIIVAAAAAVFVLVFASVVTAHAAAPTAGMDHCLLCHPQAHVAGWEQGHAVALSDGQETMTTCAQCHAESFCTDCHDRVFGASGVMGNSGASGAGQ